MTDLRPAQANEALGQKLATQIAASGPISFYDYMAACLYDPDHGYYTTRNPLGRSGDFITAPEISQIFGEVIGFWTVETWRMMGEPANLHLVELGPGRGTLMSDALRAARLAPRFLESVSVHLVEMSQPLREAQQRALQGGPFPVRWHNQIEDVPRAPAILIANEFLDCLPVRQCVFDGSRQRWKERCVGLEHGRFAFTDRETGVSPPPMPAGTQATVYDGLAAHLAGRSRDHPLAALVIDYGHASFSWGDTVQAVKRHRFVDVFDSPGETDLTAHVDFGRLSTSARKHGLTPYGPMPMGEWLLRLGFLVRAGRLQAEAPAAEQNAIAAGAARLVSPDQMGVLFKVLILASQLPVAPLPFTASSQVFQS